MKLKIVMDDRDLLGVRWPWWYGFAYRRHEVRRTVLYLIPLNLIVRYATKLYWLSYRWLVASGWRDKLDDAYWRGYNDGNTTREHHYEFLARLLKGEE